MGKAISVARPSRIPSFRTIATRSSASRLARYADRTLHIFNGVIPEMQSGDVLGHESMGEVVEVGRGNTKLSIGDRVVVPFTISCGECFFCKRGFYSGCEDSAFPRLGLLRL